VDDVKAMVTPGIVDAHIHMYAPEAASQPAAWGRAHGEPGWVECVAPEGRRSIQGWADPDQLVADMDEAGILACVMLGWYWECQETCDLQNGWYLDWIRRYPGRLMGFAAVQPAAGPSAVDALERALDGGLCGVGEVLPQAQGFMLSDPEWRRIVEIASARRAPITLHATDPGSGPAAGPPTPLGDYLRLAREYPQANFILAHWGGGLAFRGRPEGEELPPNLYFDTAASPLLYSSSVLLQALERVGPSRILYGSDYPLLTYPKDSRKPGFTRFLGELGGLGVPKADLEQVLGGNITRLLTPGLAPAQDHV
jgi:predicted TIM-barrel fold metal-dependent hydrolase